MGTYRINKNGEEFTLFFRNFSPLSNHHPVEFTTKKYSDSGGTVELKFCCNEQFYMYHKAALFNDQELMDKLMKCDDPKEMKRLSSPANIKGWDSKLWDTVKDNVMKQGSLAKYRSSPHLRFALFITTKSKIMECSPYDKYWGIGMDVFEARNKIPDCVYGKNRLGEILEGIRDMLWNDKTFGQEKEDIENLIQQDPEYLMKVTKKIDLICKERSSYLFHVKNNKTYRIMHSEFDEEGFRLIPKWARFPPLPFQNLQVPRTLSIIDRITRIPGRNFERNISLETLRNYSNDTRKRRRISSSSDNDDSNREHDFRSHRKRQKRYSSSSYDDLEEIRSKKKKHSKKHKKHNKHKKEKKEKKKRSRKHSSSSPSHRSRSEKRDRKRSRRSRSPS